MSPGAGKSTLLQILAGHWAGKCARTCDAISGCVTLGAQTLLDAASEKHQQAAAGHKPCAAEWKATERGLSRMCYVPQVRGRRASIARTIM